MLKSIWKNLIQLVILVAFTVSCGQEIFAPKTQNKTEVGMANPISSNYVCAGHTLIKPEVDILFIVDNSSSTNFLTSDIKLQLSNTLSYLNSSKFDYRVMLAPLISTNPDRNFVSSAEPIAGVDDSIGISDIGIDQYFGTVQGGATELGFRRALYLINGNRNVFRNGANTIVVMLSNGNDTDYQTDLYGNIVGSNYQARLTEFKQLTQSYCETHSCPSNPLNSAHLRFISVVAHSSSGGICGTGTITGVNYINMSRDIYNHSVGPSGSSYPDSYNICTSDYANLFGGINQSIEQVVINHTYNYWLVSAHPNIDTDQITVQKFLGNSLIGNLSQYPSDSNGFEYVGYQSGLITREFPACSAESPCEQATGYFVRLYGAGKATYPECIVVKTQAPPDYYGYVGIDQSPQMDTVVVTVNGNSIPQSSTNGWEYIGYRSDWNIRVDASGEQLDSSPYKPAINENGYFFKLNGSAIYSNSDTIEVFYKAAAL